jgi:hypothetical protein
VTRVSSREVTQTWVVYSIPLPAVWGDLASLVSLARAALGDDAVQWDDAAEVISTDEELIVRWEKPQRAPAPGVGERWKDQPGREP